MTDLLPITIFFALGLVLLLIAVESAGLPKIVRRCDADAKKKWKAAILVLKAAKRGLKDAERAGKDEAVVGSRRLAVTQGRINARTACEDFGKAVDRQVNAVRDWRRKPLDEAESAIEVFSCTLLKRMWASVASPTAMGIAGVVLFVVLVAAEVRYHEFFGLNLFPQLSEHPVFALLLGLLQVVLLFGLVPLFLAAGTVIVPPFTGLLLIMIADGTRALAAKGIAWVFLVACGRWAPCSYLALPMLDDAPAAQESGTDGRRARRLVEPAISFMGKYGARLILKDGTGSKPSLTLVSWFVVGISFLVVCYIAIGFEPG